MSKKLSFIPHAVEPLLRLKELLVDDAKFEEELVNAICKIGKGIYYEDVYQMVTKKYPSLIEGQTYYLGDDTGVARYNSEYAKHMKNLHMRDEVCQIVHDILAFPKDGDFTDDTVVLNGETSGT